MQLENKKIIVTGGGRGIGAGTVRAYVREGAKVVFCDVNDELGKATEEAANAQEGATGHATYINCDISKRANVEELFSKAMEILGGLDVLVNVAGVEKSVPTEMLSDEDISFVYGVNIYGTIYTNQEAYKIFKANKVEGAIINFASDAGLLGMANGAAYSSSKGAVISWTRTIASEWGMESNVRCNCVNPSVKTPMFEGWLANCSEAERAGILEGLKRTYPIDGSMGDIDRDLAPVMVFLATDGARYINGQIIGVNGGVAMVR